MSQTSTKQRYDYSDGEMKQHFEEISNDLDKWSPGAAYHPEIIKLSGGIHPGTQVADIGCGGRGVYAKVLESGAHITATDSTDSAIKLLKPRLSRYPADSYDVIQCKSDDIAIKDDSQDLVFSLLSVFILHDYKKGMRELLRIAKPGGKVIVQTPFSELGMCWLPLQMEILQQMGEKLLEPSEQTSLFANVDRIKALFKETGLDVIAAEKVSVDWIGPTEEGWRGKDGKALLPFNPVYSGLSEKSKAVFLEKFVDALNKDYQNTDKGECIIPSPTWVVVGQKASH